MSAESRTKRKFVCTFKKKQEKTLEMVNVMSKLIACLTTSAWLVDRDTFFLGGEPGEEDTGISVVPSDSKPLDDSTATLAQLSASSLSSSSGHSVD